MRLIDLLNKLEREGALSTLYQSGCLNLKCYSQREIYNTYCALLATPTYADRPGQAANAAAVTCRVSRSTVYTAIKSMTKPATNAPH